AHCCRLQCLNRRQNTSIGALLPITMSQSASKYVNRRTVADYNVSIGVKIRQSAHCCRLQCLNRRQNTSIGALLPITMSQSASRYVNWRTVADYNVSIGVK